LIVSIACRLTRGISSSRPRGSGTQAGTAGAAAAAFFADGLGAKGMCICGGGLGAAAILAYDELTAGDATGAGAAAGAETGAEAGAGSWTTAGVGVGASLTACIAVADASGGDMDALLVAGVNIP
jgi:hypothetical protein